MRKHLTLTGIAAMLLGGGVSYRITLFFSKYGFILREATEDPEIVKPVLQYLMLNGFTMLLGITGFVLIILGLELKIWSRTKK